MNKIIKFFAVFVGLFITLSLNLYSQEVSPVLEVEQGSNKLNVVIGVIVLIFIGITSYLVSLDKKVKRLRKEVDLNTKK